MHQQWSNYRQEKHVLVFFREGFISVVWIIVRTDRNYLSRLWLMAVHRQELCSSPDLAWCMVWKLMGGHGRTLGGQATRGTWDDCHLG